MKKKKRMMKKEKKCILFPCRVRMVTETELSPRMVVGDVLWSLNLQFYSRPWNTDRIMNSMKCHEF